MAVLRTRWNQTAIAKDCGPQQINTGTPYVFARVNWRVNALEWAGDGGELIMVSLFAIHLCVCGWAFACLARFL